MERQVRMVKRLFLLLCIAACTMGILGTPSCEIRALIIDSPSYNFTAHRIESATPPYQTDSSTVIDVPVYVYGAGAQFAFKVGADANTNCADALGYTAWTAATNKLQADIAAVPDGIVKLCLIGRSKKNALSYNTQAYSKATVYKWNKDTEGPGAFSIDEIASPSNDNTPTLSWTAATGAAAYDVKLSNAPDCSAPFQSFNDVTGTSVNAAAIADGSFHVCVAARSASNLTTQATNNGIQFVIDTTPPGDFTITAPSGTVSGLSQTAEWTAAAGAEQYHLMLTSDSGCPNMISEWNSITTTTADITVPSEGDYHLCAEAIDAANNKKLSPAMAFSVAGAPQEVTLKDKVTDNICWQNKPLFIHWETSVGGIGAASITGETGIMKRIGIVIAKHGAFGSVNDGSWSETRFHFHFYESAASFAADPFLSNQQPGSPNKRIEVQPANSNWSTNVVGTASDGSELFYVEVDLEDFQIALTPGQEHLVALWPTSPSGPGPDDGAQIGMSFAGNCGGLSGPSDWFYGTGNPPLGPGTFVGLGAPYPEAAYKVTALVP
ncbi:MAG: hypothetical protein J5J00_14360 [Deltaproteobacteria bacterium]|nr:hypothetical protein [Deltaproteobacteria bacterium]